MSATLMDELTHMSGTKGASILDEALGIVEAIVSGAGNKDSVGDIVMPGAFTKSLAVRKPRVVWGHDWNHPIGKVLEIHEISGADPRIPAKAKGQLTAALYVKVQFNLLSEKGREAFSMVAFFGEEQEWSIGYKTTKSQYDPMIKANRLHEVELFEVSPVLHGANSLTGTVSVKEHHDESDSEKSKRNMIQRRETMTRALVGRVKSPVSVVDINDDDRKVIYQTDASETFSATFAESDDGEVLFGNPTKVRMEVRYVPDDAEEEKSAEVAEDEEPVTDTVVEEVAEKATCGCGGSCCSGEKSEDIPLEEVSMPLFVKVESDVSEEDIRSAVAVLNVKVDGSRIVFNTDVDEVSMKSAVAQALAGIGVSSVSIGRLSSTDELE